MSRIDKTYALIGMIALSLAAVITIGTTLYADPWTGTELTFWYFIGGMLLTMVIVFPLAPKGWRLTFTLLIALVFFIGDHLLNGPRF